ncbi:MAG: type I methionyl aminopeptidase [Chthoniobacterales bacterium]
MIKIKNADQIQKMRASGELAANILNRLCDMIRPGITTLEIDQAAGQFIAEAGAKSAFYRYRNFPGQICISLNEEVVHGIGSERKIVYGDLVKLDVGVIYNGWIGDNAISLPVGVVDTEVERLITVTEESLQSCLKFARAGRRLGDICSSIENYIIDNGYSIVREFVGHGVGQKLHEDPQIPNYGRRGTGPKLKPGMTLAIEPMVNMGKPDVRLLDDEWTVVASDGLPSSHFEHTILITKDEPEVLTWPRKTLLN